MADVAGGGGPAEPPRCAVCGAPGLRCAGCLGAAYCGKAHQLQHRAAHRDHCWPVREVRSDALGRHLVAVRDIPAGQIVLKERPLVVGVTLQPLLVCVGCARLLADGPGASWVRCRPCGLPLCSRDCSLAAPLHGAECRLIREAGRRLPEDTPRAVLAELGRAVTVLRCLLLPAEALRRAMLLEAHLDANLASATFRGASAAVVGLLHDALGLRGERRVGDADAIRRLYAILQVNGLNVNSQQYPLMVGLWDRFRMVSHACTPNSDTRSSMAAGGPPTTTRTSLFLVSCTDIATGTPITVSYTVATMATIERVANNGRFFACACERCADPTEMGLHLGSVCCDDCKGRGQQALMTSTDPLDQDADWRCGACGARCSSQKVWQALRAARADLLAVQGGVGFGAAGAGLGSLVGGGGGDAMSSMRARLAATRTALHGLIARHAWPRGPLHATSSALVDVKEALLRTYDTDLPALRDMGADERGRLLGMAKEVDGVWAAVSQGRGYPLRRSEVAKLIATLDLLRIQADVADGKLSRERAKRQARGIRESLQGPAKALTQTLPLASLKHLGSTPLDITWNGLKAVFDMNGCKPVTSLM